MNRRLYKPTTDQTGPFAPTDPRAEAYIAELLRRKDEPVLLEMEKEAHQRGFPIVGPVVGAFLEVMALAIGARRVFEFGSGYGYSAYWFTRAVGPEGIVICTEGSQDNAERAEHYLGRVGRWDRVRYHVGWAQDVFRDSYEGNQFDIIYNDVDKDAYPEVWKLARDCVRPGGLYICDNTLWSGRVTLERVDQDVHPGWTEAIREHNNAVAADTDFDCFLNPARDGVLVARRRD